MPEHLQDLAFDLLAHDVFPPAGFVVDELPFEADHVAQQALGEAVFAHDVHGLATAVDRELEMAVARDDDEPVPFHARYGLRDGRAGMAQTFGDPGPQGDDAFLLQIEDGAEIHFGRVDQISHRRPPSASVCVTTLSPC